MPTIDTANDQLYASTGTGLSTSHTCSATSTVLYVVVAGDPTIAPNITGMTYNGESLSLFNANTGSQDVSVYRLVGPATGANTLAVTWDNGSVDYKFVAFSAEDTDTTDPDGTPAQYDSASTSSVALDVTDTTSGGLVVGVINVNTTGDETGSISTPDTEIGEYQLGSTTAAIATSPGTGGTVQLNWSTPLDRVSGIGWNLIAAAPTIDSGPTIGKKTDSQVTFSTTASES
jgi:hypothetical protein